MKIRHKQTGEVVEGVYYDTDKRRYTGIREDRISHFPIMYWEPVPEEVWEDVTAGCHVYQDRVLYDGAGDPVCEICDGYRLCNVTYPYGIHTKTAFIVERKRPA